MTGDLRAALDLLGPFLGVDAPMGETLRAWQSVMRAWVVTVERAEERRQRFEARVAEKIAEFGQALEDRTERNVRLRRMKLQIEELQRMHDDLRARFQLPKIVWQQERELAEWHDQRNAEYRARRDAYFAAQKEKRAKEREEKRV